VHIVFLSPSWPPEMPHYVQQLHRLGAHVWGVGDTPRAALPASVRDALAGYLQVPSMLADPQLAQRIVEWLPAAPDRVEALWEPVMGPAADLRDHYDLPGLRPDTVAGFRDKPLMKDRVQRAGLPVPPSGRASSRAEVLDLAQRIGFPLVLKPVAGAGSADTFRVGSAAELEAVLPRMGHVDEVAVEAFVTGPEYTYETLCVDGRPVLRSVCRYWPNTLEARQQEWISPIIHTYRSPPDETKAGVQLGDAVLSTLGMGTGLSHMEWFLTERGPVFGEVAARPPGANMVDLMNYAGDVDLYREWARAVVFGRVELPVVRPWSAAIVFKRARGQGRIRRIEGLDRFLARYRPYVARVDLLPVGAPRRDWRATFLSDGNLVVRHPDDDAALAIAREAAASIHLFAG
jgi:hypothetical protein